MVKVDFVWSWIYQAVVQSPTTKEKYDYKSYNKYVIKFIKKIEDSWRPLEKDVLKYCEEVSGLSWKKEIIPCYVTKISTLPPISDPMTIPIQIEVDKDIFTLSVERYIDMMIHELIHNLFIQNEKEMGNYFDYILDKYSKEEFDTAIHLLLHSIHKKIFLKFFGQERLNEEMTMCNWYPAYKKSWEIVKEKGEDNLINEFKNYSSELPNANA